MIDELDAFRGTSEDGASKQKPYTRPLVVEIGPTKDIVQSYYVPNPNDAYARYYTYRT
jgi:hypothetical protein